MGFFKNIGAGTPEEFFTPSNKHISKASISTHTDHERWEDLILTAGEPEMFIFNIHFGEIWFDGKIYKFDRELKPNKS